jgi:hypothetical protein
MIVVRYIINAKWGRGDEVVKEFKTLVGINERITGGKNNSRLMTDLSGKFFTLVEEVEFNSLGEWEEVRQKTFADPEFQKSMTRITDLIETGSTEFYTLV